MHAPTRNHERTARRRPAVIVAVAAGAAALAASVAGGSPPPGAAGAIDAATTAAGDDSAAVAPLRSILSLALEGGVMMIPIGICSLVALAVIVERSIVLRTSRVVPPAFARDVRRTLEEDGDADEIAGTVRDLCARHDAPAARVIAAGLRRLHVPLDLAEKHVEDTGRREAAELRLRGTRALAVVAAVAPLLGLLGTILGMITAFRTVAASADALGRTEMLAEGIYEAMITTAAGLVVAIPALLAHHAIASRIGRLVMEMDRLSVEVLERVHASVRPRERAPGSASEAAPARGGGGPIPASAAASPQANAAETAS